MPTIESSRAKAKTERLQAHRVSENEFRIYNPTSQSAYSVLKSNGTWYCTCSFATKSSGGSTALNPCKHLARVLDKEAGCSGCGRKDVKLTDRRCVGCIQLDKMGFK